MRFLVLLALFAITLFFAGCCVSQQQLEQFFPGAAQNASAPNVTLPGQQPAQPQAPPTTPPVQPPAAGGCTADSDCTAEKYCSAGTCVAVAVGNCGEIVNHRWQNYECCANADCGANQYCENHLCVDVAAPGPGTPPATSCDSLAGTQKDNCYYDKATEECDALSGNPDPQPYANIVGTYCKPIQDMDAFGRCVAYIAQASRNPAICDPLTGDDERKNRCIIKVTNPG